MLICGGDVVETFPVIKENGEPLWKPEDQHALLQHGLVAISREGTDYDALFKKNKVFQEPGATVYMIEPQVRWKKTKRKRKEKENV